MNKDFLWGETSAANQYEGGYDVRKNHEQAIHKITKYMQEQGAIIDKCCRSKDDFFKGRRYTCSKLHLKQYKD